MSPALFLFLALSPHLVFSYNIDTNHPIIYKDPDRAGSKNYFGYSVALSLRNESSPTASLFVGAPRYSDGVGKVFRCIEDTTGNGVTSICRGLEISAESSPKVLRLDNDVSINLITDKPGWLGASMAIADSSNLTVCAPHSIVRSRHTKYLDQFYLGDMRGYCYDVPDALGNTLYRDSSILTTERRYPHNTMINTLYGFSVNYAGQKGSNLVDRITGQPRLDNVEIKHGYRKKYMLYHVDEISNFGYSVSSGYFFNNNELVFVAGAPGWMRTGKVVIIAGKYNRQAYIGGSVLGEYFGASLATGDFDGDGYDDLAVGAPHWGEVDFGRVYTFYGKKERTFGSGLILQGTAGYGQFGYTMASDDLDRDGHSDLIVSAPWEGSGVVYVYYGSRDFRSKDLPAQIPQRITPSEIRPNLQIERFGFALSHPVDIDENGYPDLAIGAYKSGHAVVLRSRPVIKTEVTLDSYPRILKPDPGQTFVVNMCLKYSGIRAPDTQEFEFEMTADKDYDRVQGGSLIFTERFPRDKLTCRNETITLKSGKLNLVDSIVIHVKYSIKERDTNKRGFCSSCPVLSQDVKETPPLTLPFHTGCKNRTVCNAHLSVNATFGNTKVDNEWVVGSGDISLNLLVSNTAEPAYETEITIAIPTGIRLRNAITSCIEKTRNAVVLVCEIGNPFNKGEKSLTVDLDMGHIDESASGTALIFNITRRTRSEDHGTGNPITLHLKIKNVAYVTLTGVAEQESQDYSRSENTSIVPIRHTYQVVKGGETPISRARLTIDVPVAMVGGNDTFLDIIDPQFTDSTGRGYLCSFEGPEHLVRILDPKTSNINLLQRRRREISDDSDMMYVSTSPSVTEESEADYEPRNDTNEIGPTVSSPTTERIIYLNCSTMDVSCVKVICRFKLAKTSYDVGTMALDMVFNASAFYTSKEDSLTVKFNTNARVDIMSPLITDPTYVRNTTAGASTMLYNIPEPQKLASWILPSSIILGILFFCILAFILFRVGFFKRPKKLETAKAKEMEMILKAGGEAGEDEERYG